MLYRLNSALKKKERDLLKVLDLLLEVSEKKGFRRGRQFPKESPELAGFTRVNLDGSGRGLEFLANPELKGFTLDQERTGRQALSDDDLKGLGFEREEICEVTGFESKTQEECQVSYNLNPQLYFVCSFRQDITETQCNDVEVTKMRTVIKPECRTKHDQACNVTMKEVPTQQCLPSEERK